MADVLTIRRCMSQPRLSRFSGSAAQNLSPAIDDTEQGGDDEVEGPRADWPARRVRQIPRGPESPEGETLGEAIVHRRFSGRLS
jgi:hypothetical protein